MNRRQKRSKRELRRWLRIPENAFEYIWEDSEEGGIVVYAPLADRDQLERNKKFVRIIEDDLDTTKAYFVFKGAKEP